MYSTFKITVQWNLSIVDRLKCPESLEVFCASFRTPLYTYCSMDH